MTRQRRKTTRREEVAGNSRLRGELAAKDRTIAAQADTIESLASRISSLEAQMANRTARIVSLEAFEARKDGFAPTKLVAGNFSPGLVTNTMLDSDISGSKLAAKTVGGGRVADETLTFEQIALGTIGHLRMDKASIRSWLDDIYARR